MSPLLGGASSPRAVGESPLAHQQTHAVQSLYLIVGDSDHGHQVAGPDVSYRAVAMPRCVGETVNDASSGKRSRLRRRRMCCRGWRRTTRRSTTCGRRRLHRVEPHRAHPVTRVGIAPRLSDAELVTLAVLQALLGHNDEARFIRYAHTPPHQLVPVPAGTTGLQQAAAPLAGDARWGVMRQLATRCAAWFDDVWLIDSTPGRVPPFPRDRQALQSRRLRRLRVLLESLPLVRQ